MCFSLINVVIGTIIDQDTSQRDDNENSSKSFTNKLKIWFKCFSLTANVNKVFAISDKRDENEFAFLDGLRVILCVWVAVTHMTLFPMSINFKTSLALGDLFAINLNLFVIINNFRAF